MPWSACWMEDLVYGQTDQQMHKLDSKRLWVTTHWRFDWTEVQMDGSHAKIKQINDGIVHTAKAVSPTKGVYMCELRRFACGFVCFAECALIFRCKWGGEHFTLLVFYGQRQLGHHSSVFDVDALSNHQVFLVPSTKYLFTFLWMYTRVFRLCPRLACCYTRKYLHTYIRVCICWDVCVGLGKTYWHVYFIILV